MKETNDQVLVVQVLHKKPIVIQKFDTPLQIAHKFCCENGIELRHCRDISQSVVRLMKTYMDEFEQLQLFKKYFGNQAAFPKKKFYTIEEILPIDKENKYVYKEGRIEDMSKKLYQNILSPPPEDLQITTKNSKILRQKNQPNMESPFKIANKIFNQLDHDRDGYISPSQIDITGIPDELLNYLIGMLLEIDHQNLTLNGDQFSKLFQDHYDKLNSLQKQRFLSIK